MPAGRSTTRAVACAVALVGVPVLSTRAAYAVLSLQAQGSGTVTTSTGTWSAVATTASAPPYPTGSLALSFAKNGTKAPAPQYFWLVNTGTLPISSETTTLTSAATGKAELCSGSWNESTGACVGLVSTLGTTAAGSTTTPLSLPVGSRVRVKASLTQALSATTSLTVAVSIPRTGTRTGQTSSS